MSRYIDADKLLETLDALRCGHCTNDKSEGCILCQYDDFKKAIGKMPTTDVVEVVRCKDCTEWDEKEQECSHWYGFRENDFCSHGERREQ